MTRSASAHRDSAPPNDAQARIATVDEASIRTLVHTFYDRVRDDTQLSPLFEQALVGRWASHLEKMCDFWASLVLGAKRYRGNVQQAHQPLSGIEPAHFSRWLYLFLDTAERMFVPAAAIEFMEPALRIAQSLQLSRYGWDYQVPDEQRALLEQIAPRAIREPSMHVDALERDAATRRKA